MKLWRAAVSQERGWLRPYGLIGDGRAPSSNRETSALGRFVQFDRAVSQQRVERVSVRGRRIRVLNKLNEHGPEPNVFWILRCGIGCAALKPEGQEPGSF